MTASHLSCAIALQAALEREQDENRKLRECLAKVMRESNEKSERIWYLEKLLLHNGPGDLEHD